LAENKIIVKKENDPERKAIALAWLFHLVGDVALSADTKSTGRFQVMARSAVDKMLPGV
jgi:hypothetical protein